MRKFILKLLLKGGIFLLHHLPRTAVLMVSLASCNRKLMKFRKRPLLVRRFADTISKSGIFLAQLNVTNACNQKCPMCNLWIEGSRMPLEKVKVSIDRLNEMGAFMLTITGGEPFSHPDIGEIIDYAYAKNFFINVNTNASLPLRVYRSIDLDKIEVAIVSLHALDEEKMVKVTGVPNTLPRVIENLRYFKKETTMRIILKYVIQKDNDGEVEKVQAFADREGFTVEYHPVMVDTENRPVATNNQNLILSEERQLETLSRIMGFKKKGRSFESSVYYPFCVEAVKRKSLKWSCDAGKNYLSVYPDGRFGICKDVYTSARITDDDFVEKYRSPVFQEEMKTLREGCRGCNWSCYITASKMASLVKNPDPRELRILKSL